MFRLKRSAVGPFLVTFRVLSQKIWQEITIGTVLEFVPLRGETNFKPRPQNRVLVPLRGSWENFWQAPLPFWYGNLPHSGSGNTDWCPLRGETVKHHQHHVYCKCPQLQLSSHARGINCPGYTNFVVSKFHTWHIWTPLMVLLRGQHHTGYFPFQNTGIKKSDLRCIWPVYNTNCLTLSQP